MGKRREIRELALQVLYQLDARGEADLEQVEQSARDAPYEDEETRETGWNLARAAWADRERADVLTAELAPKWPPNRQPLVDRNILRLAYHELATERAAPAIVIDEAVELAKRYGSDRSPAFINGVLDRVARRLRQDPAAGADEAEPDAEARGGTGAPGSPDRAGRSAAEPGAGKGGTASDDPWLDDALRQARTTR